jgi:hypothetical protein
MIQSIMLCGIGVLAGCLLMLTFLPLIHGRAVRITRRHVAEATPMKVNEIQADKDHLRAQFAMSVRRLEVSIEEMRAKAAGQNGEVGRQSAEISRLRVELDKKTALIFALRTREAVRKSVVRRIVKMVLYVFIRSDRRRRQELLAVIRAARSAHSPAAEHAEAEFLATEHPAAERHAAQHPTVEPPTVVHRVAEHAGVQHVRRPNLRAAPPLLPAE